MQKTVAAGSFAGLANDLKLQLLIQMKKVRITKAPAVLPKAKDWVVWLVEIYPWAYLVKLPGGATLLTPYNKMS